MAANRTKRNTQRSTRLNGFDVDRKGEICDSRDKCGVCELCKEAAVPDAEKGDLGRVNNAHLNEPNSSMSEENTMDVSEERNGPTIGNKNGQHQGDDGGEEVLANAGVVVGATAVTVGEMRDIAENISVGGNSDDEIINTGEVNGNEWEIRDLRTAMNARYLEYEAKLKKSDEMIHALKTVLMALFAGIPPKQIELIKNDNVSESCKLLNDCVTYAEDKKLARDNKFSEIVKSGQNLATAGTIVEKTIPIQNAQHREQQQQQQQQPQPQQQHQPRQQQQQQQQGVARTTGFGQEYWEEIWAEKRLKNIIIKGIPEVSRTDDFEAVHKILEYIGCQKRAREMRNSGRLGRKVVGRNRLLMVTFESDRAVEEILKRSPLLARHYLMGNMYILRDLPKSDRKNQNRGTNAIAEAANSNFQGANSQAVATNAQTNSNTATNNNRTSETEANTTDNVNTAGNENINLNAIPEGEQRSPLRQFASAVINFPSRVLFGRSPNAIVTSDVTENQIQADTNPTEENRVNEEIENEEGNQSSGNESDETQRTVG